MNIAVGAIMDNGPDVDRRRAAKMDCPVCGARGIVRDSVEVTPVFRRLYYACTNFRCGMSWAASLCFEHVVSPSGLSAEFRKPQVPAEKPPGHDFGQMSMFDDGKNAIEPHGSGSNVLVCPVCERRCEDPARRTCNRTDCPSPHADQTEDRKAA